MRSAKFVVPLCIGILLVSFVRAQTTTQSLPREESLTGLWEYTTNFEVGLSGELTVTRAGEVWQGTIGGVEGKFDPAGQDIRFAFPNDGGWFRGKIADHGRVIEAFWQRRAMTEDPRYPSGATQSYVMPVNLQRVRHDLWRGMVKPLEDPFTLYLKIFRKSDGTLAAAFRDPEQNSHGPSMQFGVRQEGDAVRFSAQPDPQKPEIHLDATLVQAPERLRIFWEDLNRTIDLTRCSPPQAQNFYPRPPGDPAYVYRQPPDIHDGWKTARAGALNIDEAALAHTVQKIIDTDPSAGRRVFLVHSIEVAYRGRLVLDEYFFGFNRDQPHDMRSASKTFASVMLGAAMMGGTRISPETKVYDVLAPLGPFANPDPRKSRITLAHLMSHTPGFACDDNDEKSTNNEEAMESQREQPNWWKFSLDLPMAYEPGAHYAYCSANINLVGAALTMATATWLPELFDRTVARPLQFGAYYWNLMPNGEGYAGGGAFVQPRDFLKLGQTFLDEGVWNGRRVVTASWVKDSIAPHARVSPATTGRSGNDFANVYLDGYDAYAWHLTDVVSGNQTFHAYFANGNGGQLLIVVPRSIWRSCSPLEITSRASGYICATPSSARTSSLRYLPRKPRPNGPDGD